MNKELIIKYKAEFDHWLNGGKLLIKMSTGWEPVPSDYVWHLTDKLYVINDEYVEFRKALAEGKTLQYNFGNYGINKKDFPDSWKDLDLSIGILADRTCPENYRIKPEEPKFKVGDWIRVKTDTFEYDGTARISKGVKRLSKSDMWLFNENHYKCNPDNYIEHWQPKPGEWCWFWNEPSNIPILVKLISIEYFLERPIEYKIKTPSYISETLYSYTKYMYFKNCEPFIGQLPTILKE